MRFCNHAMYCYTTQQMARDCDGCCGGGEIVKIKARGEIKEGVLIKRGFIIGNLMYTVNVDGKIYNVPTLEE